MKRTLSLLLTVALLATLLLAFTSCGETTYKIAVPNDPTNEARALMLLEANGLITLREGAGINATVNDIVSNPYNIEIIEMEAAAITRSLQDVAFAVINSNYAIAAGLNPLNDSLIIEGSASEYVNVLSVKAGNENTDKIKALVAALQSQQVVDFITSEYAGNVVCVVEQPTDGFDPTVDYAALSGTTISVAASPAPHCEILEIAKAILATKGITLEIISYEDYVQPNLVVNDGEVDANYFQHVPYMNSFNAENGTDLVVAAGIHVEPMGMYAGNQSSLDVLTKEQ